MSKFEVKYTLKNSVDKASATYPVYEWLIIQKFNLDNRNHAILKIDIYKRAIGGVKI